MINLSYKCFFNLAITKKTLVHILIALKNEFKPAEDGQIHLLNMVLSTGKIQSKQRINQGHILFF